MQLTHLKYNFNGIWITIINFRTFSLPQKETQYPIAAAAKSLQSFLTLYDPIDGSPPGSSVHVIFQARVLEWGAIAFSKTECSLSQNVRAA